MPYTSIVCLSEGSLIREYFAHLDNVSFTEALRRYHDGRLEILRQASPADYERILAEARAHNQKQTTTFYVNTSIKKAP